MATDPPPRHLLNGFPESVLHFVRAMESNRRDAAIAMGMSEIEVRALFRVAEAGSIVPKELAAELAVTTGALTGIADRLVGLGFLRRTAHPDDRRSLLLELTSAGHSVMKKMHVDFIAMLNKATVSVDPDQLESTRSTLTTVVEALRSS